MNYLEVKEKLEVLIQELTNKMKNTNLTLEEIEVIQKSINMYEYIIEATCMNHFGRGFYVE